MPPPQTSPDVQALPSLQLAVLFVKTQPDATLHVSVVQGLLSLQTMPTPAHAPPLQTSPDVQGFASSHANVLLRKTHPVAGLQLSVVQTLLSLQTIAVPGRQLPPPQVSPVVHASPSSQALALFVYTHPVAGLQVSVVQMLLSLQTVAAPPWQVPAPQTSPVVQAFPSSQALVLFVNTHPEAGLQLSVVHTLPSLQTTAAPPWHEPPPQVSPDVQAFASSQAAVLFVKTQPVAGLHVSFVHTLLSLQTTAVPG